MNRDEQNWACLADGLLPPKKEESSTWEIPIITSHRIRLFIYYFIFRFPNNFEEVSSSLQQTHSPDKSSWKQNMTAGLGLEIRTNIRLSAAGCPEKKLVVREKNE